MSTCVMVQIIKGHPLRSGEVCEAKRGSMVWAALLNAQIGARVESWGITYEKVEAAS